MRLFCDTFDASKPVIKTPCARKKKLYVKMSSTIYTHWYIYGNVMILIQSGAGNRLRYIDWLHWIEDWCDFADFDVCIYRDIYLNRPNIDGLV